jgi:membrane-associated protease RseP (regulator of RpoE activity)
MRKERGIHVLAWALALGLAVWTGAASTVRADEGDGDGKKVEKHRVVIVKDGKPEVYEGDGPMVRRGYLGVALTDLTPELRTHFGVPEDSGVMVAKVEPGSPAEKAGIRVGDILTAIDGKAVKSSWDVGGKIRGYDDGQQVPIEVWRNGKAQNISVGIVERERPELDMMPFFKKGEGGPLLLNLDHEKLLNLKDLKDLPNLKEWTDESGKHFIRLQSPSPREAELEKKLKALEKRIDELQKQLEKNRK